MKTIKGHYNLERHISEDRGMRWFAFVGLSPTPALRGWDFPTLRAIRAAITFLVENNYREGAWRLIWLFSIDPANYSQVYGRLTPKRLQLRRQYGLEVPMTHEKATLERSIERRGK